MSKNKERKKLINKKNLKNNSIWKEDSEGTILNYPFK